MCALIKMVDTIPDAASVMLEVSDAMMLRDTADQQEAVATLSQIAKQKSYESACRRVSNFFTRDLETVGHLFKDPSEMKCKVFKSSLYNYLDEFKTNLQAKGFVIEEDAVFVIVSLPPP